MRVLFTCVPIIGHFHPLAPLAKALLEAGHEVAFATSAGLVPKVEASGFRCFPAGIKPGDIEAELPGLRDLPPLAQRELIRDRLFPEIAPKYLLPDLLSLAQKWACDLIISENCEFAGPIVAEHLGIAHATFRSAYTYPYPERYKFVSQLDTLRASVGLPPDPDAQMLFRYLYLIAEPPSLRPDAQRLPPTVFFVRRVVFDQSGDELLPDWVTELSEQPTVFATLGTMYNREPGLFENILEALRPEPVNLIMVIGRDRDPVEFGLQPPNVHIERYIPESLLFPLCDLVVSHAGSGTMFAALAHGLPMVNLPMAADQPENGAHCAERGAGLMLGQENRSPEMIREAVRTVLSEPSYRETARQLQREMQALPGVAEVVTLLEKLATEKKAYSREIYG